LNTSTINPILDIHKDNLPARKEWDHHAGYQWTFFPESEKRKVAHWLQEEWVKWISNADIGGGWYVNVPGSVVLDISPVSLEKNPSREKILFDLDTIGPNNRLPLRSGSLETATMISVWQYLREPEALLRDLQRVLVPGGKIYIINQDGAWLTEHQQQPNSGKSIWDQIHAFGYNVELIPIPIKESARLGHWYTVVVSMPSAQSELFEKARVYSIEINELLNAPTQSYEGEQYSEYTRDYHRLNDTYAQSEYTRTQYLETMLHVYPITHASKKLIEQAQQEAEELSQSENTPVLLWSTEPNIVTDMYQEGDMSWIEMCAYTPNRTAGWMISSTGGSVVSTHAAWHQIIRFIIDIENGEMLNKIDGAILRKLFEFTHYHAFNDFTCEKQEIVRKFLREDYPRFLIRRYTGKQKYLQKQYQKEILTIEQELRVAAYERIFLCTKQQSKAETFLARKREIEKGSILTIGTGMLSPLCEGGKIVFLEQRRSRSNY
jgi:ubiquinone/menaquinone biosynthesis C-methylase UbiE